MSKYVTQTFFKTLVRTVNPETKTTLNKLLKSLKHQELESPGTAEFVVAVAPAAVKTDNENKSNKTYLTKK